MKRRMWLAGVLLALLWATPAKADNSFIIRTTLNLQALQAACNPPLLPSICTVVGGLGDRDQRSAVHRRWGRWVAVPGATGAQGACAIGTCGGSAAATAAP